MRDDADPQYWRGLSPRPALAAAAWWGATMGIRDTTVVAKNDEMKVASNNALCEASFTKFQLADHRAALHPPALCLDPPLERDLGI